MIPKTVFRKLKMPLFVAAAVLTAAVFSFCANPDGSGNESVQSAYSRAGAFSSAEEARKAVYDLQKTTFERWIYEPEDFSAFDLACTEAIKYVRGNAGDEGYLEKCTELYSKAVRAKESVRFRKGDLPRVYIVCKEEIGRDAYVGCAVYFVDSEKGNIAPVVDSKASIRVRGHSTSAADKKPFNVKLSSDRGIFGMEKGGKWALLANHFDKTLMRNRIALDLAQMAGCYAALDSRYAEVFLNGAFLGNYLVCEPATDGKNRANVNASKGEFMIERVKNWAGESDSMFFTHSLGLRFDVNASDGQIQRVKEIVDRAEAAILSGDETAIREVIDPDSFAAMYVVQELIKDCDLFYGNCHLCYRNGLLFCGPMWDMDLSMGNASETVDEEKYRIYNNLPPFGNGSGDSATGRWADGEWFGELLKTSFFQTLVRRKYGEMKDAIRNLYADGGIIDRLADEYGESFRRNYTDAGWSLSDHASPYEMRTVFATHADAVRDLKAWLERRHEYLETFLK